MKELIEEIFGKLKDFASRMKETEVKLEGHDSFIKDFTPYDDTALVELIDEVQKAIPEVPEVFDPSDFEKKLGELEDDVKSLDIPDEYDDSKILEMMDNIRKSIPTIPTIPAAFDSSELKKKITEVEKSIPTIPEFKEYDDTSIRKEFDERIKSIKEYDDSELQQQINGIKTLLEKEVTAIKKEIDTPLKVQIPTTKHYDGEVSRAGEMVLHENNLYVNLLNENDSEPSSANKSYKLIIKAPKAPVHKGVYNQDETYEFNDIVMWDNASWIKTYEPNQELPSEGWKLLAKGIRGKKGEKGSTTVVENDYGDVLQDLADEVMILKAQLKGYEDATD